MPTGEKSLDSALYLTFSEARRVAAKVMIPAFRLWYVLGWGVGSITTEVGTKADEKLSIAQILQTYPDVAARINTIDAAADSYIQGYFDEWWSELEGTTQKRLRSAIESARTNGLQPGDVADLIEDQFGRARAELIATTEVTRLIGGGMQASYAEAGLSQWEWQTVRDERVCPICEPKNGQKYAMATRFEPAHPRCRCFPRPVVPAYA